MPEKDMIIFKEKPFRTLISLNDDSRVWYANVLCKHTDTTYPHMLKILKEFESVGLIRTEQVGRIRTVRLTSKGKRIAKILEEASELLSQKKSVGNSNNVLEGVPGEGEKSDS